MEGFKQWMFSEMPVNIRHLGNWDHQRPLPIPGMTQDDKKRAAGFKKWGWHFDDFQILTNKNGIERMNRKWLKVPEDVEMYLLRSKTAYKQQEVGEVQEDFLERELGLRIVQSPQEMKMPNDIYINPHAINIIYTNNAGADRMPFTYWTAAHRLGHAIRRDRGYEEFFKTLEKELRLILKEIYGRETTKTYSVLDAQSDALMTEFIKAIGTMKSARDGTVRNVYEFGYELLAQWMTTGKIRFNPIPKSFGKRGTFGRPGTYTSMERYGRGPITDEAMTEYNEQLETLSQTLEYYAETALSNAVGKIFVM